MRRKPEAQELDGVGGKPGEGRKMKQFTSHSEALAAWQSGEIKTGEIIQVGSCPPHTIVVDEPGTARVAFASEIQTVNKSRTT